ncbi:hypothetical protein M3Y99_01079200 [Aphelenchoides fujianensis]|nr:hypothetical protein M3Y99_01079200 [Aphelenchoides fujianensis]
MKRVGISAVFLLLVASVRCAPIVFPQSLVLSLFPQSVMSVVLQMSEEQKTTFAELYAKQQNGTHDELNDEQAMELFEELRQRDADLFEMLWPVVMETKEKMSRMDEPARSFFEKYLAKANSLSPMLEQDRDAAIRQLLKFAVAAWFKLPDDSKRHFRREFPQMAVVFEDTQLLKFAGVRVS